MNKRFFQLTTACGLLLAGAVGARSQPLTIQTMAGNLSSGATNGFGSNARFNRPQALTADGDGNVYVADTVNGTIRKIEPNGFVSTYAGTPGVFGSVNGNSTNALFKGPQGVAADNAGNIFVADTANGTIRKITPGGTVVSFAGAAGNFNSFDGTGANAQFYQPTGIATDNNGNVYVSDTWNHTIRKITSGGVVNTLAGLAGYVGAADGTNSKARFNRPSGIAVDPTYNLFVADSLNHTIRKITPSGTVTTIAGAPGLWGRTDGTNRAARFFQPEGIVCPDANTLYVVDSGNQTLRKLSASGTNWIVTTVAGLAGDLGSVNGTGTGAKLGFPAGLGIDSAGYLYVADSANNQIRTTRVISPTLQFVTVGNKQLLTWPVSSAGFTLESSPSLNVGAVWTPVTNGIVNTGDNFMLTNSPNGTVAFYRLHKP